MPFVDMSDVFHTFGVSKPHHLNAQNSKHLTLVTECCSSGRVQLTRFSFFNMHFVDFLLKSIQIIRHAI